MKTNIFSIYLFCFVQTFFIQRLFSQTAQPMSVGINTDYPQATLHIAGTLRVDSLENGGGSPTWNVVCDSQGNFSKQAIDTAGDVVGTPLLFGEAISAGDVVCVGDGRSAYMSTNGDGLFQSNEVCNNTRFIAQGFYSTSGVKAIRALEISLQITSGATHYFNFFVRESVGGIPGPTNVATGSVSFVGTGNATGWNLFMFDPPLPVLPNKFYYIVMQLYVNTNTSRNVRTVANSIATGVLAVSMNSGNTWTTYPTRDVEMRIYETRSIPGVVYRAQSVWKAETLRPDQVTVLATSSGNTPIRDYYDKSHNYIGVATESGVAGAMKKVYGGPIVSVNQSLVPGTSYVISDIPGQVSTSAPGGSFAVPVGFAIDSQHLYLVR